jgi:hypothetical protein
MAALPLICAILVGVGGTGTPQSPTESSVEIDIPLINTDIDSVEYVFSHPIDEVQIGPNHDIQPQDEPDIVPMDPCILSIGFATVLLMFCVIVISM